MSLPVRATVPALLALCWLVLLAPAPTARAARLDVAGYEELLRQSAERLRADPGAAAQVAAELANVAAVELPDGRVIVPDLTPIIEDLNNSAGRPLDDAANLAATAELLSQSPLAAADATSRLGDVLARGEFQGDAPAQPPGLLQRALDAISRRVTDPLIRLIAGLLDRFDLLVALAGLALLAGVGAWVWRSLRRSMGASGVRLSERRGLAGQGSAELRAEAERLSRAGAYRPAVRMLYLAVLVRLDERGLLRFDRALTDHEVLIQAGRGADAVVGALLAPLVERFERYWYAGRACAAPEYTEFAGLAQRTWDAL